MGILTTEATLLGVVNPNGLTTTTYFEYGPTGSLGSVANVILAPPDGSLHQAINATITGLQAGTVYYYRVVASNSAGQSVGTMASFTTSPTMPFLYTTTNNQITITKYVGSDAVVSVPQTINGNQVVTIGHMAFANTNVTSVTLPPSIVSIAAQAFQGCTSLANFMISGNVTSIGSYAFQACSNLTTIDIPASVTSIGDGPFAACGSMVSILVDPLSSSLSSLSGVLYDFNKQELIQCPAGMTGELIMPASVTQIRSLAFQNSKLSAITIGSGVTTVGSDTFRACHNLVSVVIPESVTSVSGTAFSACTSLTSISVAGTNPSYSSFNGVLFDKNREKIVSYPAGMAGAYNMPSGVQIVGAGAFAHCTKLTGINFPPGITTIEGWTFTGCSGLSELVIPNSVTTIGPGAFAYCTGLTGVAIPSSVTSIGEPSVNGYSAWSVFPGCSSLVAISVDPANPNYSSRNGVLFNKIQTVLLNFPGGKRGGYDVPSGVTRIHTAAFSYDANLVSITIPESVTAIGDNAFDACEGLTSATFLGDAPSMTNNFFRVATSFKVYFPSGKAGFTLPQWKGYPSYAFTVSPRAVWANTSGGSWMTDSNWQNLLIGDGSAKTCDFSTVNISGDQIVTLDGPRTIGNLRFGDATPSHNWTLATGSGGVLTLQSETGFPFIEVVNQRTAISTILAGFQNWVKSGDGTLSLSGINTHTGSIIVEAGTLNIQGANALGAVAHGTQVVSGASLEVQGGISLTAEPITLAGSGISDTGSLRSVSGNNTIPGSINLLGATRINSEQVGRALTLSNTGAITGTNNDLTIGGAGNTILNGAISTGAATFTKDGTGTVLLTSSANSALPTNVVVDQGILELTGWRWAGDSMTGAGVLTVNSEGTLRVSYPHALGGSNNGFGEKIIVNGGTFTLNSEQYLSDLELNGGTVNGTNEIRTPTTGSSFKVAGTVPSYISARVSHAYSDAVWTVANVTGNSDGDFMVSGSMTGSYGLAKAGAGTMVLTGANTYTGPTTVSQGTLQIGNGSTTGTLSTSSVITNNGTLVFNRSNTVSQGADFGDLTGSGSIVKTGSGALLFNRENSYGGYTTVGEGILQINDGARFSSRGITNNATIVFQLGVTATQTSIFRGTGITGNGGVVKKGLGTLGIDRANSYSGPTTIAEGTLAITSSGTLSVNSTITNDGTFQINRSGDTLQGTHFSGSPITGSGRLEKRGAGTLTLTAANTYTGETSVVAGTLKVAGNSINDTGKVTLSGGKIELESNVSETVGTLYFGSSQQYRGTWGSSQSSATHKDDARFTGTGVLIAAAGPMDYSAWASTNAPGQAADQDYDQDGVPNGVEYFMGTSDSGFTANPNLISGTVTWPKSPAFSGSYQIQTSTDLSNWTDVTNDPAQVTQAADSVIWTRPAVPGNRFVRLVVQPN